MKRLQLKKTEKLVLSDPQSSKPFSIPPLREDSVFAGSIMSSCTLGFLFILREDDHESSQSTTPHPLSLPLGPPIIVINGSSQKDKPGWP